MLAKVMPGVLEEEVLLVELKNSTFDESIKSVVLLTLDPEFCNIDTKPHESEDEHHMWCWNLRRSQWQLLDFRQVESAENWPPINDK